jgi:uncharacterized protein
MHCGVTRARRRATLSTSIVRYFALFYDVVEDFVARRQAHRAEHLSMALAAHTRGELVLAGALAEPADGALLVFRCVDRSVAEDFARRDPYVRAGLVTRWTVRPWSVVIGGESSDPGSAASQGNDPLVPLLEAFVAGVSEPWLGQARRFRREADVSIGELGAHPDLGERLRLIVEDLPATEFGVYYRMFAARTRRGRIFALAQGTGLLRLRVGRGRASDAYRSGAKPDAELGPDWVDLDAWNPEPTTESWLATLRELAALARAAAD